ncbi:MAG: hypothetical protein AAFZ65_03335 [Planctomycetota bacterium]
MSAAHRSNRAGRSNWTIPRTLAVAAAIVLAAVTTLLSTRDVGLTQGLVPVASASPEAHWRYLLEDNYDRQAYMMRGRWIVSDGTPYLEEFSEYPQLQTLWMGVPWLFLDHGVLPGEPHTTVARTRAYFAELGLSEQLTDLMVERVEGAVRDRVPLESVMSEARKHAAQWPPQLIAEQAGAARQLRLLYDAYERRHQEYLANVIGYGNAHHALMAGWWLALIAVLAVLLRQLGRSPAWALLMLLPSTLYYGFNRGDLPVVTSLMLAVTLYLRDRRTAGAAVIGFAGMLKWFPLFVFPLFLSWGLQRARRQDPERSWSSLILTEVVRPGAIAGVIVVACLGMTYVWDDGGWEAVRFVFEWHLDRPLNHASVLSLLCNPDAWGLLPPESVEVLSKVFLAIQLGTPLLLALLPMRKPEQLLTSLSLAVGVMIVFSKFFSPQWMLWLLATSTPLLVHSRWLLGTLLALQVALYLQLPVAIYERGVDPVAAIGSGLFAVATNLRVALFVLAIGILMAHLPRPWRRLELPASPEAVGGSGS